MKGPWRITLDTNPDDCNLTCIMCEEFSPYSDLKQLRINQGDTPKRRRMDFKTIEKAVTAAAAYGQLLEIIPSTMGEPLMYKDFEKILQLIKEKGLKLNLTTNGTFPRKSVQEWAELIIPITSDIKISWNGASKEVQEAVMQKSEFKNHVSNLKDFLKIRNQIYSETGEYCRVTLQTTFMEMNIQEFPDLIKFAAHLGVDRLKGHHLWAHFTQIKDQSMKRSPDAILRWNRIVDQMQQAADLYRRPDGSKILLDNVFKLKSDNVNQVDPETICPFLGQEAWIAWNGKFNPCCAPDEQRKQLGDFGNINEISFRDIWEGSKYQDLVSTYKQHTLCQSCNMRRPIE